MLKRVEYSFKIFVCYENSDEFEELNNIFEFSLLEELDNIQKTLRLTIFSRHLQKLPRLIKVIHLNQRTDIFEVEQTTSIDLYKKEIIAKTPINVPQRLNDLYQDIRNLGVEAVIQGRINETPQFKYEQENIKDIDEFCEVFDSLGFFWFYNNENKLIFTRSFKVGN